MEALKKVFSPGHQVDDELMYGSGDPKAIAQPSETVTAQASNPESTGISDATAQPSHPTSTDPSSYRRPHDSNIGQSDHQTPKSTSETADIGTTNFSRRSAPHTTDSQSKDFATSKADHSRIEPDSGRSKDGDAKVIGALHSVHESDKSTLPIERDYHELATHGKPTNYTSHPPQPRDTTSRVVGDDYSAPAMYGHTVTSSSSQTHPSSRAAQPVDNEPRDSTAYGQSSTDSSYPRQTGDSSFLARDYQSALPSGYGQRENMSGYSASTGAESGVAAGAVQSSPVNPTNTPHPQDKGVSGVHYATSQPTNQPSSGLEMPGQYPMTLSDNPYSSTHLDPRVDPHASPRATSGVTSTTDPADYARGFDYPGGSERLSGSKTTAEPFESSHVPRGTAEPFAGPKGTSEPLQDENRHQTKAGAVMGKIGLGSHGAKHRSDDRVLDSNITPSAGIKSEPSHVAQSGVQSSPDGAHVEDHHKEGKGGLLGALGLKGHGSKTHAAEEESSTVEPRGLFSPTEGRQESRHVGHSGVGASHEITQPEDSHKERKSGLLGVIGLKKHESKDRSDEQHSSSTAEPRELLSTTGGSYEQGHVIRSGAEPSHEPTHPEDSHKDRKGGLLGVLGLKKHGSKDHSDEQHVSSSPADATPFHSTTATGPTTGSPKASPASTAIGKPSESHTGRNAAIGGVAVAGAGTLGAHEYSVRQAEQEEQDRIAADVAHQRALEDSRRTAEKEQKAHEKALAKEEKKAEKEHEKVVKKEEKKHEKEEKKAEKAHEKAILMEEKKAEKEHEKLIHAQVKEAEKEHKKVIKAEEKQEKEHEKEIAKQEKEIEKGRDSEDSGKKTGGLLGLFKRRRDSKGNEIDDEEDEHTTAGTTATTGTGSREADKHLHHAHGKHHEMNKLHKDPPPGYEYAGDSSTRAYADYPVQENEQAGARSGADRYAAPNPEHDGNKTHHGALDAPGSGSGSGSGLMINRPRGGYGDEVHLAGADASAGLDPHDGITTTSPADNRSKHIAIHSDGKRHYEDGSLVDAVEERADDGSNKHGHEGSKIDKVLEKLHLKSPSEEKVHAS